MIKICLIDNYDSFTYNVFHYFAELGCNVTVVRNDKFKINELKKFDKIVISPGPGNPDSAGLCLEVLDQYLKKKPIFGICLGHQIITQALGGKIIKVKKLMHGKTSEIKIFSSKIFKNMPNTITGTRYHSLVADPEKIPEFLKITAITDDGVIMGLSNEKYDIHGIQFHPESIKTTYGKKIIKNFLKSS
jgi:anthranilate synthase/aminodeoxychorismate synthase-like glutamine amidotransferase